MFEFMGAKTLYIDPAALPQLMEDMRSPRNGIFLFSRDKGRERPSYEVTGGVAVIRVQGLLSQTGGFWSEGYERIRAKVKDALEDGSVRAVLLNINSPGGIETGLFELSDWLHENRDVKPMYAYSDGLMTSAAYCIAASTGRVFSARMSTVGSIGVVRVHTDWSKWNEQNGLAYTWLHAGKYKVVGNPDNPLSAKDRAYIQERLDHGYAQFLGVCERGMGLSPADAANFADGQIFYGDKAEKLGLVSEIVRDRDAAVERILANLSTHTKETDVKLSELTLEKLREEHPELHAQLVQAAKKEGEPAKHDMPDTNAASTAPDLAGIEAVCAALDAAGQTAMAGSYRALGKAGFSLEQISALSALAGSGRPESGGLGDQADKILAELQGAAASAPVGNQPKPKAKTEAQEQAELIDHLSNLGV